MSGIPQTTLTEARGGVALPSAEVDKLCIVVGPSSIAPDTGEELSLFFLNSPSLVTNRGYGDAVDVAAQVLEETQTPVAMYTTPDTTPGSYGDVDNTSVTGTALFSVDATVTPFGTTEPWFKVITGGTVGTSGITFQWSLDAGRKKWSNTIALGTAHVYEIPNSGVKFTIEPSSADLTALNTLLNEIKTDLNAHVVLTTGTVHSNADNASVVATANATNTATRIALANALKAAYNGHRVKGSGGSPAVHINVGGDTTNIVTSADATNDQTALTLALELKTKLNAHDAGTTWHTIADATNVVTAAAPSPGTLVAGDIGKTRTFGPKWGTTDIEDAGEAIRQSPYRFGLLVIVGAMSASEASTLTGVLDDLDAAGKRVTAIVEARVPDFDAGESDADWNADVAADWDDFADSRIHVRATYGLLTDARTGRQYRRSDLAQFVADTVRVQRAQWPSAPADGAMDNFLVTDSVGALVGHDEGQMGASTGLSNDELGNRFGCNFRDALSGSATAVFTTVPWVMFDDEEDIKSLPVRRVANAIERSALAVSFSQLGGTAFYTPADPSNNLPAMLLEDTRSAIHSSIFAVLNRDFRDDIQNFGDADQDTGLVQVSAEVTVTGGNLVQVPVTLRPMMLGFLFKLPLTLAIKQ